MDHYLCEGLHHWTSLSEDHHRDDIKVFWADRRTQPSLGCLYTWTLVWSLFNTVKSQYHHLGSCFIYLFQYWTSSDGQSSHDILRQHCDASRVFDNTSKEAEYCRQPVPHWTVWQDVNVLYSWILLYYWIFFSAICWCLQPAWRLKTNCRVIVFVFCPSRVSTGWKHRGMMLRCPSSIYWLTEPSNILPSN